MNNQHVIISSRKIGSSGQINRMFLTHCELAIPWLCRDYPAELHSKGLRTYSNTPGRVFPPEVIAAGRVGTCEKNGFEFSPRIVNLLDDDPANECR